MNRLILNKVVMILATISAIAGMGFLFWILATLTMKGLSSLHFSMF